MNNRCSEPGAPRHNEIPIFLVGWDIDGLLRQIESARDRVLARINGPAKVGSLPVGNNSFSNPYRPNFLGSCCHKGANTTAPEYVLRP